MDMKPKPLSVELPASLDPVYANVVLIAHSPSEIIVDFSQAMPNQPQVRIKSRVVMTPLNAKLFMRALQENLGKYEANYGEIPLPGQGDDLARAFFGGGRPPESED
ncbi:MAG: DUF3467 domain-containing protein [Anaerolineae bacterium]|jgi:hypothetical protein|nr:DUF3467 domain-containing protein [Anaerolineae bacterium]